MLECKEKTIGDKNFKVWQLGCKESRPGFFRLARIISPVLGNLVKELDDEEKKTSVMNLNISTKALGSAIASLADVLKDDDLEFFIAKFAPQTEVQMPNGNWVRLHLPGNELIAFGGNLKMQFEWLYFALEVNYGSFLGEFLNAQKINETFNPQQAKTASKSQNTSTGTSTESLSALITNQV